MFIFKVAILFGNLKFDFFFNLKFQTKLKEKVLKHHET